MDLTQIANILEMGLLCREGPCPEARLLGLFKDDEKVTAKQVRAALAELDKRWAGRALELSKTAGGWQLRSLPMHGERLRSFLQAAPPRLSRPLTEVLAIVAYRQPVTRGDIESIRGVSTSVNQLTALEDLGWVQVTGKRDTPGRPFEYGTTEKMLDDLGLSNIGELPPLESFFEENAASELGGAASS